jgi:solute carrier family 50 protein (sugar transporter)
MDWQSIVFEYVCPIGGCLLASSVFAAPINDLNHALGWGSLGSLNTTPWAVMTGNCLGWCAYSYYTADPFVLASNLPGLILSLWLNIGACKLQYLGQFNHAMEIHNHEHEPELDHRKPTITKLGNRNRNRTSARLTSTLTLTSSPQDVVLFSIVSTWAILLVCVRWLGGLLQQQGVYVPQPQTVVGMLVNINLVFFYGAPLQTMKRVLETKSSDSIHTPTVTMNVINAVFWMSYGLARDDVIIYGPNSVGFILGIGQVALCCIYPKRLERVSMPGSAGGEETAEFRSVLSSTGSMT